MRTTLSKFLATKAIEDKNFHVLTGDHGYALFDEIRKVAPMKFFNTGITEQAMVGCAAGMTKTGKRVAIYGLSAFIPMRVLEFIKMTICYEGLPVIMLGDGAGTVYTTLGASHQCLEDLACLRPLPVDLYSPADGNEMNACLEKAYKGTRPAYIRIGKADRPSIHNVANITALNLIQNNNSNMAIIGTGSMSETGLKLAQHFKMNAYSAPFLSDLKSSETVSELQKYSHLITIEEHSTIGGLGDIVIDALIGEQKMPRITKLGATKSFTKGCGSYDYALQNHGLDFNSLKEKIQNLL